MGHSLGPKAAIGNTGFTRFLKVARGSVTIDVKAVRASERIDGEFVLQTDCYMMPLRWRKQI